jgi:hypothetical protein
LDHRRYRDRDGIAPVRGLGQVEIEEIQIRFADQKGRAKEATGKTQQEEA